MPSNKIDDFRLRCSRAEARSRLTRLIAEGYKLHGALQSDYETKLSGGVWNRKEGASALQKELEKWSNNTVKSVLNSIFPTRAEWDQVTTVERPVVFSGSKDSDSNVEGALQHFARILRELTAIRDSQLASYDPPNKVEEPPTDTQAPARQWNPPAGYVGTNEIANSSRFRKATKNPVQSTIQRWVERDRKEAKENRREPVKIVRASDTHENYYPESWVSKQIHRWNPRASTDP